VDFFGVETTPTVSNINSTLLQKNLKKSTSFNHVGNIAAAPRKGLTDSNNPETLPKATKMVYENKQKSSCLM